VDDDRVLSGERVFDIFWDDVKGFVAVEETCLGRLIGFAAVLELAVVTLALNCEDAAPFDVATVSK